MRNLNTLVNEAQLLQLKNQSAKFPHLRHQYTTGQFILIGVGWGTVLLFGIGIPMLVIGYIWHAKADPYKVLNTKTQESFLMSKAEFKKYRDLEKQRTKSFKSATDILQDK